MDPRTEHMEAVWAAKEGVGEMAMLLARLVEDARTSMQAIEAATGGTECPSSNGLDAFMASKAVVDALEPLQPVMAHIEECLSYYGGLI